MLQGHDTMLNDRPLRVLVVDDHAGIRLGISRLIDAEAPRMCSVGAVGSIHQALAHTRALRPDVVVLDVNLDGEDGLALIPALQGVTPCAVVVLTSLLDPRVAERAIALGAQVCVHKSAPAEQLINCIAAAWPGAPISNPFSTGGDVSRRSRIGAARGSDAPMSRTAGHPAIRRPARATQRSTYRWARPAASRLHDANGCVALVGPSIG